jgi:hypothetical protein
LERFASALQFAEALEAIARIQNLGCTPAQLGLFLRRIYDGEADLPVDDIFDWNAGAVPFFAEDTPVQSPTVPKAVEPPAAIAEPPAVVAETKKKKGILRWLPFVSRAAIVP